MLCQKQTRAGTSNYFPQTLWDVITCPCPGYVLLAQHSSYNRLPHDPLTLMKSYVLWLICPSIPTTCGPWRTDDQVNQTWRPQVNHDIEIYCLYSSHLDFFHGVRAPSQWIIKQYEENDENSYIPCEVPLIARFMGPTWGPPGADRTLVGPMLAPETLLSGTLLIANSVLREDEHYLNQIKYVLLNLKHNS